MNERRLQFQIGLFLLIALFVLGILIVYNTEGWASQYTVYVKPQTAPGVSAGTPVRKNGIRIGRVSQVKTQDDHVALTLRINESERIYEGEVCSIGAGSFLGDSVIEVVPVNAELRGELLENEGLLTKVAVKRNPMELIDVAINLETDIKDTLTVFQQAGQSVDEAGKNINTITEQIQELMKDENGEFGKLVKDFRTMSQKTQLALDNFNRVFDGIIDIVGDPQLKVKVNDAVAALPKMFEEVQTTIKSTRETIESFKEVSGKAAANLENLEPLTESLKTRGPEVVKQVQTNLKNIDDLVLEIKAFAKNLEDFELNLPDFSQGTIGKLLNETELYDNINEAVRNIKDETTKLEPLMNDIRMFADGLARDPGQLGVRGAIDRRPANTGYKGNVPGRERLFRR